MVIWADKRPPRRRPLVSRRSSSPPDARVAARNAAARPHLPPPLLFPPRDSLWRRWRTSADHALIRPWGGRIRILGARIYSLRPRRVGVRSVVATAAVGLGLWPSWLQNGGPQPVPHPRWRSRPTYGPAWLSTAAMAASGRPRPDPPMGWPVPGLCSRQRIRLGWCWRRRGGADGGGLFGWVLATSSWRGGRRADDGALGMPQWCFSLCWVVFSGSVVSRFGDEAGETLAFSGQFQWRPRRHTLPGGDVELPRQETAT